MELEVIVKSVYGNKLIYPACEKAKLLCQLSGNTTFTARSLIILKELGHTLTPVAEQIPELGEV